MKKTEIIVRSKQVTEILNQTPHWFLRWGITIISLLFISLFILACFFNYPETYTCTVLIKPENLEANEINHPYIGQCSFQTSDSVKVILGHIVKVNLNDVNRSELYASIFQIDTLKNKNETKISFSFLDSNRPKFGLYPKSRILYNNTSLVKRIFHN